MHVRDAKDAASLRSKDGDLNQISIMCGREGGASFYYIEWAKFKVVLHTYIRTWV